MIYFTSDLHIGHYNIIKYRSSKNFSSLKEHDEFMLNKISELKKRDILYIIGDFIFKSKNYDYYINEINKMSCRIKLVMGNHDDIRLYKENRIEIQLPIFSYKNIWISHIPIHPNEIRNRLGNIHGHLHEEIIPDKRYFNVNIDVNNYEFVNFDYIKTYFKNIRQ